MYDIIETLTNPVHPDLIEEMKHWEIVEQDPKTRTVKIKLK